MHYEKEKKGLSGQPGEDGVRNTHRSKEKHRTQEVGLTRKAGLE